VSCLGVEQSASIGLHCYLAVSTPVCVQHQYAQNTSMRPAEALKASALQTCRHYSRINSFAHLVSRGGCHAYPHLASRGGGCHAYPVPQLQGGMVPPSPDLGRAVAAAVGQAVQAVDVIQPTGNVSFSLRQCVSQCFFEGQCVCQKALGQCVQQRVGRHQQAQWGPASFSAYIQWQSYNRSLHVAVPVCCAGPQEVKGCHPHSQCWVPHQQQILILCVNHFE
jgi:hypothetical protein